MKVRRLVRQVLGVAVLAWLFAPAAFGQQTDIIHRYSFTNDASDSVGTANGTLMGDAVISGNQVVLDGTAGTYVDLSAVGPDIGFLTDATFEAWVTVDMIANWARIFDFGQDTTNNMFLVPSNGSNGVPRFALTTGGAGMEQQVQAAPPFPVGTETHVAVTIDSVNQIATLYINGLVAATIYNYSNAPYLMGATINNYLGRSQYAGDPYLTGSIDEFRIYARALADTDIATSYANGPDGTPP
jgi:hypothetical protein